MMGLHQNRRPKAITKIIIAVECAVIVFLGVRAYQRYSARFTLSVSPLVREDLSFPAGGLKYFFEPIPGSSDQRSRPAWLSSIPRYTINADALNDRFDYTPTKPDGVYRIITLGDSFTYGLFVNTSENWTEILEDKLNKTFICPPYKKFEVINLGYLAYDPKYEVERYRRRGEKYNPDLIVWLFNNDDFDDILKWGNARVDLYRQELLQTAAVVTHANEGNFWERSRKDLLKTFSNEDLVRYHTQTLRSLNNYFTGNLLIYSMKYVWGKSSLVDNHAIVANFVKTRPRAYLYVSDKDLASDRQAFPDYHPNKEGHAFIAQDILKYLTENAVIPCKN